MRREGKLHFPTDRVTQAEENWYVSPIELQRVVSPRRALSARSPEREANEDAWPEYLTLVWEWESLAPQLLQVVPPVGRDCFLRITGHSGSACAFAGVGPRGPGPLQRASV